MWAVTEGRRSAEDAVWCKNGDFGQKKTRHLVQVTWLFKSAVGPTKLLLEALDVFGNGSGRSGLAVFGASAETESSCDDSQ